MKNRHRKRLLKGIPIGFHKTMMGAVKACGNELTCFKAYDIRGCLGDELNEGIVYRIARAYAAFLNPQNVVIGSDVRHSSPLLKQALAKGLQDAGVNVWDIGLTGTEEVYFATWHWQADGGIEVTASHNPLNYNGLKLVREGARPLSGDSGLREIQALAQANDFTSGSVSCRGSYQTHSIIGAYVEHLLGYLESLSGLRPLTIVVNAGNGAAGHVINALEEVFLAQGTVIHLIKVHHEADGSFPHGIPNPLLPQCRHDTARAVVEHGADMGIAFDGDFDRCFFFDECGNFIESYYIVGLLAERFLVKNPGAKVIHDPRLTWNTIDRVNRAGGITIQSKTGHAFMKERMRQEGAIYGGEMSGHHYFRDFSYCDSGMIPWLLMAELLSVRQQPFSHLVADRMRAYPCSGEINYCVSDVSVAIEKVLNYYLTTGYCGEYPTIDRTDGISVEFSKWRFNLRGSNTEPLLRLNVESRGDRTLVMAQVAQIAQLVVT